MSGKGHSNKNNSKEEAVLIGYILILKGSKSCLRWGFWLPSIGSALKFIRDTFYSFANKGSEDDPTGYFICGNLLFVFSQRKEIRQTAHWGVYRPQQSLQRGSSWDYHCQLEENGNLATVLVSMEVTLHCLCITAILHDMLLWHVLLFATHSSRKPGAYVPNKRQPLGTATEHKGTTRSYWLAWRAAVSTHQRPNPWCGFLICFVEREDLEEDKEVALHMWIFTRSTEVKISHEKFSWNTQKHSRRLWSFQVWSSVEKSLLESFVTGLDKTAEHIQGDDLTGLFLLWPFNT